MTYVIGGKKISASELAKWSTADSLHDYKYSRFWIEQIQMARSNAYRRMQVYALTFELLEENLREELAAIGVEIVSDSA